MSAVSVKTNLLAGYAGAKTAGHQAGQGAYGDKGGRNRLQ